MVIPASHRARRLRGVAGTPATPHLHLGSAPRVFLLPEGEDGQMIGRGATPGASELRQPVVGESVRIARQATAHQIRAILGSVLIVWGKLADKN